VLELDDVVASRYRLVRSIGHGGMADVFEAVDESSGVRVALKIVRSSDAELARRFAQEIRALEMLEHPGLVRLLDSGNVAGQAYLVMEMVDGTTLAETLRGGPLGTGRTALIGAQVALALAYAHERGVVHRDVKPSNILLTDTGDAKLSDFGVARLLDDTTMTQAGTTLGTAAYMAPEQLENNLVSSSADVWSLGMVLLECLVGRRIYEGSPSQVVARRLAGPVPIPAELPVSWKLLLGGMLDHRTSQRLTAAAVAQFLSTAPFHAEWTPRPMTEDDATLVVAFDLAGLAPSPSSTSQPPATQIAPGPSSSPARAARHPHSQLDRAILGVAIVAALLLGLLLRPAFGQSPPTTTQSPTTTTVVSRHPSAYGTLAQNLAQDVLNGAVPTSLSQSITTHVEQALVDASGQNAPQATTDLQQAFTDVSSAISAGTITPLTGTTLERDVTSIATALAISLPSSPTTTVITPPTFPPGPGNGHGHGHGNQ
jgi:eukaryotic-like serine/threonine-protein kinase